MTGRAIDLVTILVAHIGGMGNDYKAWRLLYQKPPTCRLSETLPLV